MAFTEKQIVALSAKLDGSVVKTRQQSGRILSYLEGWHVIAEANRIFGYDGWTSETVDVKCVAEWERQIGKPPNQKDGWGVAYTAKVRVTVWAGDRPIVREGVGFGSGIDADIGQAHESAIKEAETDARKRALMTFGNPFGLALYDKTQENVERNPAPAESSAAQRQDSPTQSPAQTKTARAMEAFWARSNYNIPLRELKGGNGGSDWLSWRESMWKAAQAAPNLDAILKLEQDNKACLMGYRKINEADQGKLANHLNMCADAFSGNMRAAG